MGQKLYGMGSRNIPKFPENEFKPNKDELISWKIRDKNCELTLDLVSITVFSTGMHVGVTVFVVFFDGITEIVVFL